MDEVIKDLNKKGDPDREKHISHMRKLMENFQAVSKILGVNVLMVAQDPEHGFATSAFVNNRPDKVTDFGVIALMLEKMMISLTEEDQAYMIPVLNAIGDNPNIKLITNRPDLFEDYNKDKEDNE